MTSSESFPSSSPAHRTSVHRSSRSICVCGTMIKSRASGSGSHFEIKSPSASFGIRDGFVPSGLFSGSSSAGLGGVREV